MAFLTRLIGVWARRRQARLDAWRAALEPGARCWVITPGGATARMTIHSRHHRTVDLLISEDDEGPRCWTGVDFGRLFPREPADWEVEAFEELQ